MPPEEKVQSAPSTRKGTPAQKAGFAERQRRLCQQTSHRADQALAQTGRLAGPSAGQEAWGRVLLPRLLLFPQAGPRAGASPLLVTDPHPTGCDVTTTCCSRGLQCGSLGGMPFQGQG